MPCLIKKLGCMTQLSRLDRHAFRLPKLRRKTGFSVRVEIPHYTGAEHLWQGLL